MKETRPQKILAILCRTYGPAKPAEFKRDAFETLVMTIISQNTTDKNASKAFVELSKHFKIKPRILASAESGHIEKCLRLAGLQKQKARVIQQVSRILISGGKDYLKRILSLPAEQARDQLMQFPGIGPKTADVLLLFAVEKPTIPIDTHVNRVAKRLGLATSKANYEETTKSLQSLYDPKDYLNVHVLLIAHGREFCRARKPICTQCPIDKFCPSKGALK